MTNINAAAFVVVETDERLAGPVRAPENASKLSVGSIHDDATAQKLGFRGGTVAANIHFEQFPPLMEAAFGRDWHKSGGLSLYFLNPTTDGEPVQAFMTRPVPRDEGGMRAQVWMEDANGVKICEGTASSGPPDEHSALRERLKSVRPATDLRILKASKVGDQVLDIAAHLTREQTEHRAAVATERMPSYYDASVWGEVVAAPALAIDALRVVEKPLFQVEGAYVGMFGAIDLQWLDGPVFVQHDYRADGRVLALSESPKTEVVWYESTLKDASDNRPVARMVMMTRLLKASSPHWS